MNIRASTIVTSDHFQHYIPLLAYSIQKSYPEYGVDVGVIGKIDSVTKDACSKLDDCYIKKCGDKIEREARVCVTTEIAPKVKIKPGVVAAMRFLYFADTWQKNKFTLVMDSDFLVFRSAPTIHNWFMSPDNWLGSYSAYHGAKSDKWSGDKERIAGGYIMLGQRWFNDTINATNKYMKIIEDGETEGYREEDEVILFKICTESGLQIPKEENMPREIMGIHLGDFKDEMEKRWKNVNKMMRRIPRETINKYLELSEDRSWQEILNTVCDGDAKIKKIFANLNEHIKNRGLM